MKQCTKCKEFKQLEDFYGDKDQTSGLRPDCKVCCGTRRKKNYDILKADPIKYKEVTRRSLLKQEYGLTLEKYGEMFVQQNGCCAICTTHQLELKKMLCVDHNHKTGKIRGLLCDNCNRALGALKDKASFCIRAAEYLSSNV